MKQLLIALKATLVLTVLTGVMYPLLVTGLAKTLFPAKAGGSMIQANGRTVGSELIGQRFTKPEYFHGRPSAAGNDGYDAAGSTGSNLGPTSQKLADRVTADIKKFREENPAVKGEVPGDAVTASGSGLDPHVSPEAAAAQVARVAVARGMTEEAVRNLVAANTEDRQVGVLGEPRVNVLKLNLALDALPEEVSTMGGRTGSRLHPDELLRRVQAEEHRANRGRLKVFLGYAPRVGKSLRMFDEGRRRKERGQDVVVAAAESEMPEAVREIVERLDVIPAAGGAIDVDAIVQRRPEVCLIDHLAFRNPAGSRNAERWQDVESILRAGIGVITAANVQYIAEQQDAVERLTGKRAGCSVPEKFLQEADEIEVVDAPPDVAVGDARVLAEMRELALLLAADLVDRQLQTYLDQHGIGASWGTQERILVCLTPRSSARVMLESGERNARRFHGALLAAYVEQMGLEPEDAARLDEHLELAREMGAQVHRLDGGDYAGALLEFARQQRVTQLYLGHSQRDRSPVEKLIDAASDFDVRLFPHAGD